MIENIDEVYIDNKLKATMVYIRRIEEVLLFDKEEIVKDFYKLHTLERLFQLIVDEIVDVNTHIIRRSKFDSPNDFQSSFRTLSVGAVLPDEFADRIAPTVGLRNRIVHRYEEIDPDLLIHMAQAEQGDFREYVRHIYAYLKKGP